MRFWDSSAVVSLLVEQPRSRACGDVLRSDVVQMVRLFTRTEVLSALHREERSGTLDAAGHRQATGRLERLAARWSEVDECLLVRDAAERVLRVHALRVAGALQLGAALVGCQHRPRGRSFVALDEALATAAEREGFEVVRSGG